MIDKWQSKVRANQEAHERWMRRLLYAASKLAKLRAERKALMKPPRGKKSAERKPEDIPRMAAGGTEFNDEVPI